MGRSLVQEAAAAFSRGDYIYALSIYRQLADHIGEKNFRANIQLCIKRVNPDICGDGFRKTFLLTNTEDDSVILDGVMCAINSPTLTSKKIDILGFAVYKNVKDTKYPRALATVKYFDASGEQIHGNFKGLAKSDQYDDFHYLNDTRGERAKLFSLHPPEGAIYVKVELHPFRLKQGESVTISNQIRCEYSWQQDLKQLIAPSIDLSILGWPPLIGNGRICMMSIFDEFSRECFAPHANLVEPRPDNAIPLLKRDKPELLFVESTWRGNKSTWQYRVAQYHHPPGNELLALVAECKQSGVPTVFWNKEDPVHFDNFIHTAESFDYIFTTAEEAVPRYQERCKAKVHALPFAAEANLHNPIGSAQRNNRVCFAGSYYANRFKERRDDQLMLLDAASAFNFDIFDRNAGAASRDFCFPERFDPFTRGKLPYAEMNKAYHKYRVFLNVNSVIDSNTMFSRRVFELLACGTPIVSTVSLGIYRMFGRELVWTVRDKGEAEEAIRHLMQDDREWRRRSLQGIRSVFAEHTFAHRFDEVLRIIGLREGILPQRRVLLVGEVSNQAEADALIDMQARQTLVRTQTCLLLASKNPAVQVGNGNVKTIRHPGVLKPELLREAKEWTASHIALLDSQALYGKFYLQDALNAFDYTNCPIVGKPSSGIDTYDYSTQLAYGSLLMRSDYLPTVDSPATDIRNLETAYLSSLQDKQAFCFDAANYLKREAIAKHTNTTDALLSIEI